MEKSAQLKRYRPPGNEDFLYEMEELVDLGSGAKPKKITLTTSVPPLSSSLAPPNEFFHKVNTSTTSRTWRLDSMNMSWTIGYRLEINRKMSGHLGGGLRVGYRGNRANVIKYHKSLKTFPPSSWLSPPLFANSDALINVPPFQSRLPPKIKFS
ncbi:hypothetical protein BYT27DRAFT_7244944 [Phlegmacium glaucopus]|nr:hypothetical protein BYT27DRAFT_7244944 [Phlegmacium glaucopus]